jgi:hypothetical protein
LIFTKKDLNKKTKEKNNKMKKSEIVWNHQRKRAFQELTAHLIEDFMFDAKTIDYRFKENEVPDTSYAKRMTETGGLSEFTYSQASLGGRFTPNK